MRTAGAIALGVVATIVGVMGADWFTLAGLYWDGGFRRSGLWETGESQFSVAFAVVFLVIWAFGIASASAICFTAPRDNPKTFKVLAAVVPALSIIAVATATAFALAPPSAYR